MPLTLRGQRVLITAGPTREFWDPVRYLSNASSGLMGLALATEARRLGANVRVILGPVDSSISSRLKQTGIDVVSVVSAREMFSAVKKHLRGTSIFVAAAAVADYRPSVQLREKIKRGQALPTLTLRANPDILAWAANVRPARPSIVVGFALESSALERQARSKLKKKRADWIVANSPENISSSFGKGLLLGKNGQRIVLPRLPKQKLAQRLWQVLQEKSHA